jgi:hypothetical protein
MAILDEKRRQAEGYGRRASSEVGLHHRGRRVVAIAVGAIIVILAVGAASPSQSSLEDRTPEVPVTDDLGTLHTGENALLDRTRRIEPGFTRVLPNTAHS